MEMNIAQISLLVSMLTLGISLFSLIYFGGVKLGKIEVKVDTMWDYLLKRAAAEGVNRGLLTINSPLKITAEGRAMLERLRPRLQQFYADCIDKKMSEHDLAREIESAFGSDLVRDVCIPNGINLGVCVLMALGVAKGTETLDTILDHTSGNLTI